MTVLELKEALQGKEFTEPVKLGAHMTVTNVDNFLRTQFLECDMWTKDLVKYPAYERLVKFYEVTR